MNSEPLIDYFNELLPLTEEEEAFVKEVFAERRIRRRQFILQEGLQISHLTLYPDKEKTKRKYLA